MQMTDTKQTFWALVELMGHQKIAGLVSEVEMGGAKLLRVDVPDTPEQPPQGWRDASPAIPAYTRFVGGAAIYAITPMSEEACRALIASLRIDPVYVVGMHHIERTVGESPKWLAAGDVDEADDAPLF